MSNIIELLNISKVYHPGHDHEVWALRDVCSTIPRGKWTTITGTSGSGKSSLLALMAALDRPTSGQVLVDGSDISFASDVRQALYRKDRIGVVFQEYQLLEQHNGLENVAMPLVVSSLPQKERESRARALLEEVGLGHRLSHLPRQLSGGERQRLALARALIRQPEIIFADEPTSNIDKATAGRIISLLKGLVEQGTTMVVVSHEPELVEAADHVLVLEEGRLVI
jgi:putative ABC transport system ATP-binding protein